jgi:ribonuclease P protein component
MLSPEILRKKKDFTRLYNKGNSKGSKHVVLFFIKNDLPYKRRAFLASKKVGNSVRRNRARRLMKESYNQLSSDVKDGYDILFIARNNINGAKCQDVAKSMNDVLKKAKLLKTKENIGVKK